MADKQILIIGAGLAAITLAREIRKRNTEQAITLITADDGHFYSKPMLSNGLAGGKTAQSLVMTARDVLAKQLNATILPRQKVVALDTQAHQVKQKSRRKRTLKG